MECTVVNECGYDHMRMNRRVVGVEVIFADERNRSKGVRAGLGHQGIGARGVPWHGAPAQQTLLGQREAHAQRAGAPSKPNRWTPRSWAGSGLWGESTSAMAYSWGV